MGFWDRFGDFVAEEITLGPDRGRVNTLTLDACKVRAYEMRKEYPQIAAFILKVDSAGRQNENIRAIVGYLDGDMRPITLDGVNSLASVYQARTVDKKIVDLLDGNPNAICKL